MKVIYVFSLYLYLLYIQTNAARKGLKGVVFAYLDGDRYFDFAVGFIDGR